MIYRGYGEALRRSRAPSNDRAKDAPISPPSGDGVSAQGPDAAISLAESPASGESSITLEGEGSRMASDPDECTDLILMVHGIGQGVSFILCLTRFKL